MDAKPALMYVSLVKTRDEGVVFLGKRAGGESAQAHNRGGEQRRPRYAPRKFSAARSNKSLFGRLFAVRRRGDPNMTCPGTLSKITCHTNMIIHRNQEAPRHLHDSTTSRRLEYCRPKVVGDVVPEFLGRPDRRNGANFRHWNEVAVKTCITTSPLAYKRTDRPVKEPVTRPHVTVCF